MYIYIYIYIYIYLAHKRHTKTRACNSARTRLNPRCAIARARLCVSFVC